MSVHEPGVIPIEETKRIDWNAIRAEYIGGGISQRKLAKKYGVSDTTLIRIMILQTNRHNMSAA